MYAVVRIAGKQFHVRPNEVLRVPRLDAAAGASVSFDEVLALDAGAGLVAGRPLVAGARVTASIVEQLYDRKIMVFHKKRRKDHRKKNGHQQPMTALRIQSIQVP